MLVRSFLRFFLIFMLFSGSAIAGERRIILSEDCDYFGFDYKTVKDVSLVECKDACLADKQCKAFTFNVNAGWCFLKNGTGELKSFAGAVAGQVVEPKPVKKAEKSLPRAGKLKFISDTIDNEATAYALRLEKLYGKKAVSDSALFAQAQMKENENNVRNASFFYAQAAGVNPKSVRNWLGLTRTVLAMEPKDSNEKYKLPRIAVHSAINAYRLSWTPSTRADALRMLALGLERRKLYRPAIEAYKESLGVVDSVVVREAYLKLRAEHGFRVIENTVDSDSSSPRICVQFSEDLATDRNYESFITVDGKAPVGLERDQRQLCVKGIAHGNRYRIGLRTGLPSQIGEVLEKPVTLNIYVRDRKPALRFTGNQFVLPRVGTKGIPLVSINTKTANIQVFRVDERTISALIQDGKLLSRLDGYDIDGFTKNFGEAVWKGSLSIKSKLNEEVTTLFPVEMALPERKAGVYVMLAEPKGKTAEDWQSRATQWFVISDTGIAVLSGDDGLHIFTRSLATAEPLAGVKLQLLSKANVLLGEAVSDKSGYASFAAGLARGEGAMAPGLILARTDAGDFVFNDLSKAGFDLSDRGVTGRKVAGELDLFMFSERGIYRAGETVHLTGLLRSSSVDAIENLPLTVEFERPDGKVAVTKVLKSKKAGGYTLSYELPANAMRGTWLIKAYADKEDDLLAEKKILVEDFVPDRIEFDLTAKTESISRHRANMFTVAGRFLYGAPAADLRMEADIRFTPTHRRKGYPGYLFGLDDDETSADRHDFEDLPVTNEQGKAQILLAGEDVPDTIGLMDAKLNVRLREAGGRAVERSLSLPVEPNGTMIGIKPDFEGDEVAEGEAAGFSIIAVNDKGERVSLAGLEWSLVRVERNYQWYRVDDNWKYEPVISTSLVDNGKIDALSDAVAKISRSVDWGRYRLEVKAVGDEEIGSSVSFSSGWYVETASTETPDGLEIALDKEVYNIGDTARLKISPRYSGKALVSIGTGALRWKKNIDVPEGGSEISIPVSAEWGAGVYVTVSLYRPGKVAEKRMPGRAIGVKWLKINPDQRQLSVRLEAVSQMQPRGELQVPIRVDGVKAGEKAYVTLAAVDVGILNLTAYKPPSAKDWYFGQRQMGMSIYDIYGKLIDGYNGVTGQIRTGGDGPAGLKRKGSPPKQKLVAFYSGIVKVGDDGRAVVKFKIPQFNGTVRLMAVAWSKTGVGNATSDVIVRDPVVVTASMPRFLAPGDKTGLRLDIANTDGPAGDYQLTVTSNEFASADLPLSGMTIKLDKGQKRAVSVPVSGDSVGTGVFTIHLSTATGPSVEQQLIVPVRAPQMPVSERKLVSLSANGGGVTLDKDFLAGLIPQTAEMSVGVSRAAGLDVPSLLMSLDRYPYGCAEQTTSRALPLLYLSEVASAAGLGDEPAIRKRVQKAIERVSGFQSSAGSFGMWGPGSDNLWLDAYVTDFLTRAVEKKYSVSEEVMTLALDNLSNRLSYDVSVSNQGNEIAYALYVLARNKRASIADLRYYVDAMLSEFESPLSKAHLAASLGLYGEKLRSQKAFKVAYLESGKSDDDYLLDAYGSRLRNQAAILALASEARPAMSFVQKMVSMVSAENLRRTYTSTQEKAWLLLAARALYADRNNISLSVNGETTTGNLVRKFDSASLSSGVEIINRSNENLQAAITVTGIPSKARPAGGNGFEITRKYYNLAGSEIDPSKVAQNERFVVVLEITEKNEHASRIVVSDLLPAGFEIANPSIMSSASLSNFDWLPETEVAHKEFRDDRFVAALNRSASDARKFSLAYMVRAVTPGRFVHPAAVVEDMYRAHLSGWTSQGVVEVFGPKP